MRAKYASGRTLSRAETEERVARQTARLRGQAAEEAVARTLQSEGWTVLAQNWRGGGGELDLVVARDGILRFVEVKHRSHSQAEPVHPSQVRRLRAAAEAWMQAQSRPCWREACFWLVLTGDTEPEQRVLDPF